MTVGVTIRSSFRSDNSMFRLDDAQGRRTSFFILKLVRFGRKSGKSFFWNISSHVYFIKRLRVLSLSNHRRDKLPPIRYSIDIITRLFCV